MKMRRIALSLAIGLLSAGSAQAGLDVYLKNLNISAQADIGGFRTQVGAHFGPSGPQLDLVFGAVEEPAAAAVCLWLAKQSHQPIEVVVREYSARKKQGWGALAKSLGIKPGSPAFKALKKGSLGWQPTARSGGKGKVKGKGKGKNTS